MHVLALVGIMMLGSPQPLVLKSGTVLKCEAIDNRGEWVVVTLSPEDQHYKATGQGNTFKIDAAKVDWDKTDELRWRLKDREEARRQRNADRRPAVLDQDGLSQYRKRAEAQEQATQGNEKQEQEALDQSGLKQHKLPNALDFFEFQNEYNEVQYRLDEETRKKRFLEKQYAEIERKIANSKSKQETASLEFSLKMAFDELEKITAECEKLEAEARDVKDRAKQAGYQINDGSQRSHRFEY